MDETQKSIEIFLEQVKTITNGCDLSFGILVKHGTIREITWTIDPEPKKREMLVDRLQECLNEKTFKNLPKKWRMEISSGGILMEPDRFVSNKATPPYKAWGAKRLNGTSLPIRDFEYLQHDTEAVFGALAKQMNPGEIHFVWNEQESVHRSMHYRQQALGIENLIEHLKTHKMPLTLHRFQECAILGNYHRSLVWINL